MKNKLQATGYKLQAKKHKFSFKYFKKPELIASILMISWAFAISVYSFNSPPAGCTPGSCDSPLTVDFTNQTVSVANAPTSSGNVATKGYVDSAVGAAGDATEANQALMMGTTFSTSTDSLEAIRDKINTLPTSAGNAYSGVSMLSPRISGTSNYAWAGKNCMDLSSVAAFAINGDTTTVYTDWRLPSMEELGIFSYSLSDNYYLWTTTPHFSGGSQYYTVNITSGANSYADYNNTSTYVRCVR